MSRQKEGPTREETGRGGGRHGTFCLLYSGREKAKARSIIGDGDGPDANSTRQNIRNF